MKRIAGYLIVTLVLAGVGLFVGAQLNLTTFKAGDVIKAEEVNQNFQALAAAVAAGGLPQSCGNGQIPEWDGAKWVCGVDDVGAGGGGDITAVTAGAGLTGGGESGGVTLEVAFEGSGSAESAARSDHAHDERYYQKAEVDAALAALPGAEGVVTGGVDLPETLNVQFNFSFISETFTTTQAGKLLLSKFAIVTLGCETATDRWYFLTLDGEPLRGSVQVRRGSAPEMLGALTGVTEAVVPAGEHTLGVGGQCYVGAGGAGSGTTVVSSGSVVVLL